MKFLIQRVNKASVEVEGNMISSIPKGFLILIGIESGDSNIEADKLIKKTLALRIFNDSEGKMNLNILSDDENEILAISQFTLCADTSRGNRPSFIKAAKPDISEPLYDYIVKKLNNDIPTKKGIFGADMKVELLNDGPVTIMLEEKSEQ